MDLVREGIVEEKLPTLAQYSIVWRAPISEGPIPDGVQALPCKQIQFWNGRNCKGRGKQVPLGTRNAIPQM